MLFLVLIEPGVFEDVVKGSFWQVARMHRDNDVASGFRMFKDRVAALLTLNDKTGPHKEPEKLARRHGARFGHVYACESAGFLLFLFDTTGTSTEEASTSASCGAASPAS